MMQTLYRLLALIGLIWIMPLYAHGATYYVAKTGNNSYTCTHAKSASTPKLTIAVGLQCLSSGDTLIIRAGTYNEGVEYNAIPSGTTTSRTIVTAAPGETVIINGTNSIGDAFSIYDRSYITLNGLTIDGHRLRIGGNTTYSHYITVQNSVVRNVLSYPSPSQSCVTQQGPGGANSYLSFINNKIYNCGPDTGHGLYLSASHSLAENNLIHDVAGYGIHNYYSGAEKNASYNVLRANTIYNAGYGGVLISSGDNNIVHHNIIRNNTLWGIRVAYGGPDNAQFYNNTIYSNGSNCVYIESGSTNTKVKNNLCLSNSVNTIVNNGTSTVISRNRLSADATLVVDVSKNLFSPRTGSPLIDAGEIIYNFSSGTFLGSAPDQGAIEFAPTDSPTPPVAPGSLQVSSY